ncbi:MAG: hypothetical protein WAO56_04300 [Miniphocaeibacter sp.]|uniref:hypothetical protein n=1 Tax=Miniphocaeibacter sp. TaxID=3100973 RepID=UPI0017A9EAE0|nr:hypothetical protein [Gallicola sp.]
MENLNEKYTIDDVHDMLEEIASTIPEVLLEDLQGGIVLIESAKMHPKSINNTLYINGEYVRNRMYNLIRIYYGSIIKTRGHLPREQFKDKLEEVLIHELRHHIEFKCNDFSLIKEDKEYIRKYLERYGK